MNRYRNTWAEINLDAIGYNIQQLKNLLPEGRKVMGVVKANGYGHGSVKVAKTALNMGVDFLMVAILEEAVKLRKHGIEEPILVIGRVPPRYAYVAANLGITLSVFQLDWLESIQNERFNKPLSLHIEFETGMNRTGIVTKDQLKEIVNVVKRMENVRLTGAYTHFATADEIGSELFNKQRLRYEEMLETLTSLYPHQIITHIGNSAAGIQYSEKMLQYTRFGVSIYGLYPSADIRGMANVKLKQAFSLYSELIQVKKVSAGESVSYGATFITKEDAWIGTVPIGYGDGWRRGLQGFYVLVDGKKMPIVGRICMDLMMIKLDKQYEVGKKVTLIGEDNGSMIEMDDVANYLGTINYEIPCMLTDRIPRMYV
ncbi:alanine racemase [Pseudogracilibacillus sp. SO30301A]|uniref:alanine racemase n=1 Tax=Pseudogracilibacillus sp. SO30301A TaxID=3098291 RepID=UPI00300E5EB6